MTPSSSRLPKASANSWRALATLRHEISTVFRWSSTNVETRLDEGCKPRVRIDANRWNFSVRTVAPQQRTPTIPGRSIAQTRPRICRRSPDRFRRTPTFCREAVEWARAFSCRVRVTVWGSSRHRPKCAAACFHLAEWEQWQWGDPPVFVGVVVAAKNDQHHCQAK
jgi:hypothetical protein